MTTIHHLAGARHVLRKSLRHASLLAVLAALASPASGRELHVSPAGDDSNEGTPGKTLRTISEAARRAQPGDVVTVHEGVYRARGEVMASIEQAIQ